MRKRGKTRQARRTRDAWRAVFAEQAESGLTQRAFCESRGLLLSTFCNAKRRTQAAEPVAKGGSVDEFIAVTLDSEPAQNTAGGWDIELTLGDGMALRLRRF